MSPIANFQHSVQPPVVATSITDIDTGIHDFAARIIAARYQLTPHVAHLVCELAHIGQEAA